MSCARSPGRRRGASSRTAPGVRRDDDLVDPRLELCERVLDRLHRARVDDEALGGDARLAQRGQRSLEPRPADGAARVLVDDVALVRLVDRRNHGHEVVAARRARARRRAASPTQRSRSRSRGRGSSVGADRPGSTCSGCGAAEDRVARAGTPYSYGPPTTCGISSKLKIGGGEQTCHSSVIACHGFARRDRPVLPRARSCCRGRRASRRRARTRRSR